jgi:hypothetical protein
VNLQQELAASYDQIGDLLLKQRKLDDALQVYRSGFVIWERLAATDRDNTGWQHELAVS